MLYRALLFSAVLFAVAACGEQDAADAVHSPEAIDYSSNDPETQLLCPQSNDMAPGFAGFHEELTEAAHAHDIAFFQQVIAEDIRFSFGADASGRNAFFAKWELDTAPETSKFWGELQEMLRLGHYVQVFEGETPTVIYPCTFHELPQGNWLLTANPHISAFDYVVATHETSLTDESGKKLRATEIGETLLRADNKSDLFQTHDGLKGTLPEDAYRSPVDYRMFLSQVDNQWTITLFVAGD